MTKSEIYSYLYENADTPIKYRVAKEFLKDERKAAKAEEELLSSPLIYKWIVKLKEGKSMGYPEHGAADAYFENALPKLVQLGLNAEMPIVKEAISYYIDKIHHPKEYDSYFGRSDDTKIVYRTGRRFPGIMTANFLADAGLKDAAVTDYLLGSLDEMVAFVKSDCKQFYITDEEREQLRGVPKIWREQKFIRPELTREYQFSYPLIYDYVGLYTLYELKNPEVNAKIETVLSYIATDTFHNTIKDGYGVLVEKSGVYHAMGWDPKYPGWFSLPDMKGVSESRMLYFALMGSRYPYIVKTEWFQKYLSVVSQYRDSDGLYCFPAEYLRETSGNTVLGSHLSFGENRRKKNYREIESTFIMQIMEERWTKQYV